MRLRLEKLVFNKSLMLLICKILVTVFMMKVLWRKLLLR
ncbi:MAG TPA: hypothetical protein [Caudoviricetes sp.]|nr:MAG TPA: hypothetical protein [Caudoviricetes sp.]